MNGPNTLGSRAFILAISILLFILILPLAHSVEPFGASTTPGTPQRAPPDGAGSVPAQAGNVTELMISGFSVTQTWQGYYGNVTGTIQLADGSDQVLYNWANATVEGEIYASRNNTLAWGNIQCFNFTANGTGPVGNAGETNLAGINLSVLESQYNIESDDIDGVNETFTLTDHDQFFTANLHFSANECRSARIFGSSGQGQDGQFEEVLLYEPTTAGVVFTALLEENLGGFNGGTHDFEMLVLEDGHGADTDATSYYFYVELE